MAAIVATNYSVELSQIPPVSVTYNPLLPTDYYGKLRISYFQYALTTEVAGTAIVSLCKIPKLARVLVCKFITSATTSTSTFGIGLIGGDGNGQIDDTLGATVADNATWWGTVPAVAGAQTALVANTAAQHNGYILTKDCYAIMSVLTTTIGAPANVTGYFEYVVD